MAKTIASARLPVIQYLITAGTAIQEKTTDKWSYIGIFDGVGIRSDLEFTVQTFYAGFALMGVPAGDAVIVVYLEDEFKNSLASVEFSGQLVAGSVQTSALFEGVVFKEAGRYFLRIKFNGSLLKDDDKYFIDVVKKS